MRPLRESDVTVAIYILLGASALALMLALGYQFGSRPERIVYKTVDHYNVPCPTMKPCPRPPRATLEQVKKDWHLTGRLVCHSEGRK